jgi:hypothetical protein
MMFRRILTICGVLALAGGSAFADIGYIGQNQSNSTQIPPLQAWAGPLGMEFRVNSAITITYMGVYNANALTDSELVSQLQVAIFQTDSTLVPGTEIDATAVTFQTDTAYTKLSGDQYDLFQSITPITLQPGYYAVVAVGFTGSQPNGNQGFVGGVGAQEGMNASLTYLDLPRYGNGSGLYYPEVADTYPDSANQPGPPNRYDAGTFATPEPGFYSIFAVFALGFVALFAAARRKNA